MPKVSPIQNSFNTGEISPLLLGRTDAERYKSGLAVCQNYIAALQGYLTRRPGTKYAATAKDSTNKQRVIPFSFSTNENYLLEFGDTYIRFFTNDGLQLTSSNVTVVNGTTATDGVSVLEGNFYATRADATAGYLEAIHTTATIASGDPLYLTTPYAAADLNQLKFAQSADVLYITHPQYPVYKLERQDTDYWTLRMVQFLDGPYLAENSHASDGDSPNVTITPSAATGTVTLTAGPQKTISGAADNGSGLIRITATSHGFLTGQQVVIGGVTGTTEANNALSTAGGKKLFWTITKIDANTFDLQNSTFTNAYVSGGTVSPRLFRTSDTWRLIRLKQGDVWGWGQITSLGFGSTGVTATCQVFSTFTDTSAKSEWQMGAWFGSGQVGIDGSGNPYYGGKIGLNPDTGVGFPAAVCFFQDRAWYGGAPNLPARIDGSNTADYENFQPTIRADGSVIDSNACSFSLNSTQVNPIKWLAPDPRALLVGTTSSEWAVRASSTGEALTPTNVTATPSSQFGSADIQPAQSGNATLFIQRSGRKLREMTYLYYIDAFKSPDMTEISAHITEPSVTMVVSQRERQPLIWTLRSDGVLACSTYEREDNNLRVGWHRHILGGRSDAAGSAPIIESIAVIPSPDGSFDQLWLSVKRYVNGSTVRTIEYMTDLFNDQMRDDDAYHADCGAQYNAPKTITGITNANPGVVTSAGHGFANNDQIKIYDVIGMTDVNEKVYKVAAVTTDTFELADVNTGVAINTTTFGPYVSGGTVRKMVTTISGLSWLEGETVSVLCDGAAHPDVTVSSGAITLQFPTAKASIGYKYSSEGQMLRLEAGSADGTSIGQTRRTHRTGFMVDRTMGLSMGMDFSSLIEINFRDSSDNTDEGIPFYTGIVSELIDADYDYENQICFRQNNLFPGAILAIMPQMVEQDR